LRLSLVVHTEENHAARSKTKKNQQKKQAPKRTKSKKSQKSTNSTASIPQETPPPPPSTQTSRSSHVLKHVIPKSNLRKRKPTPSPLQTKPKKSKVSAFLTDMIQSFIKSELKKQSDSS
jgi:hypothetical protein